MPYPIGYKTLVNVEMGFLYVWLKLRLENSPQNGNMKKNVLFSPLFLYNLALITHDATKSVNPSTIEVNCLLWCFPTLCNNIQITAELMRCIVDFFADN